MRVYHPQGMYNNIPPENVFLAADEMGNEIGVGYIIRVMQPNVFPDRPVNLFISMECQPVARYMLFGALVARARQMRDEKPQLKARVYTAISPGDARTKEFYLHNGFTCEDTEDMLRLEIPAGGRQDSHELRGGARASEHAGGAECLHLPSGHE